MARSDIPHSKEVRDLLNDLLGRDIDLGDGKAWTPTATELACAAEYADDHDQLTVLVLADIPFAVYTGAALGLVPPGGAQDMVAEKSPSPDVLANFYEVLNIASSLFNKEDLPHVRITRLTPPGEPLADPAAGVSRKLVERLDLDISIKGYGTGRLAFVLA